MEKSAHYFIAGLFVTVAVFAFIIFTIWMQGPQAEEELAYFTIEFHDSISGLEEGSSVQYKGVKVGKVVKTHLVPGNNNLVRVDIGINKETPIQSQTKVVLQTQGITGLVRMEMSTPDGDTTPPERRADLPHPVLQGEGAALYKFMADLSVISAQTVSITKKLDTALDARTIASLRAAISNSANAATSARRLADKLMADPSQILYQPSKRGVEIPK